MCPYKKTHWRYLVNTIQPFVCGCAAVLCQMTLTTFSVLMQWCMPAVFLNSFISCVFLLQHQIQGNSNSNLHGNRRACRPARFHWRLHCKVVINYAYIMCTMFGRYSCDGNDKMHLLGKWLQWSIFNCIILLYCYENITMSCTYEYSDPWSWMTYSIVI